MCLFKTCGNQINNLLPSQKPEMNPTKKTQETQTMQSPHPQKQTLENSLHSSVWRKGAPSPPKLFISLMSCP